MNVAGNGPARDGQNRAAKRHLSHGQACFVYGLVIGAMAALLFGTAL